MKPLYVTKWRVDETENLIGARGKWLLIGPKEKRYLFKLPKNNRMRFELWSEIIASQYGKKLGLNIVSYQLAVKDSEPGVLCPSFTNSRVKLTHGTDLLKDYVSGYDTLIKKPLCSFQQILIIFESIGITHLLENVYRMLIFDALIGNSDRHTENWGILHLENRKKENNIPNLAEKEKDIPNRTKHGNEKNVDKSVLWNIIIIVLFFYMVKSKGFKQTLEDLFKSSGEKDTENKPDDIEEILYPFSKKGRKSLHEKLLLVNYLLPPIYDLSSCLGAEMSDDDIEKKLQQKDFINVYINKGKQEILSENESEKKMHFHFLKEVRSHDVDCFDKIAQEIISRFDEINVVTLIDSIDKGLPKKYSTYKLSLQRKCFIQENLLERQRRLKALIAP